MSEIGKISGVCRILAGVGDSVEGLGDLGEQRQTGGVVRRAHRAITDSYATAEALSALPVPSRRLDALATTGGGHRLAMTERRVSTVPDRTVTVTTNFRERLRAQAGRQKKGPRVAFDRERMANCRARHRCP